jgi:hypothetical protein
MSSFRCKTFKAYTGTDPMHPYAQTEEQKAKKRAQYHADPERFLKASRKWHEEHRDYTKEYYTIHPKHSVTNKNRTSKMWVAQNQAIKKYPLAKFCELCPTDDVHEAVNRHHPDYNYPSIFLSLCKSCHVYVHKDLLKAKQNDCGRTD